MNLLPIYASIWSICLLYVDSLMFHVKPNHKKCLREEIHKNVLVTGDYDISEAPGQKAFLRVSFRVVFATWCVVSEYINNFDKSHSIVLCRVERLWSLVVGFRNI